ncbi:MAG: 2OG-Fe(II) oxygenase family protein [Pseudomonadales bacterium]|nr:2OG-Fe(II) oxygenase family protein [Pseudomonadales bacterium]
MNTADLEAIDYEAPGADERFVASLRGTGFGVLRNHPLDAALVDRIYARWTAFFASEEKRDYYFDRKVHDGWFPPEVSEVAKGHAERDIKEYFHFYPHGRCPEALREDLQRYYDAAQAIAARLLGWIERLSPPDVAAQYAEPLGSMIEHSPSTLLRILHYPSLTGGETPGAIRAAAHEDINLLTILPAASAPGLQVLARDGRWLDVPCDFGNLIVNVGDMLQEATGGWLPSTTHRVINPAGTGEGARMSLPLFLHPRPEVVLSERYTAGAYLQERLEELGVA